MSAELWSRLLDVVEEDIVPSTRKGVEAGNKSFGAAILRASDTSLVAAGTNEETASPLWHGEMAAKETRSKPPHSRGEDARSGLWPPDGFA